MHPETENTLLIWVNRNACPTSDVSSEIIKEMGIRILDGVNEIGQDEKKIHFDFF